MLTSALRGAAATEAKCAGKCAYLSTGDTSLAARVQKYECSDGMHAQFGDEKHRRERN